MFLMRRFLLLVIIGACVVPAAAFAEHGTVIFFEQDGFPAVDTAPISAATLAAGFPDSRVVSAAQLDAALGSAKTRLLVLPYGSTYPEQAWPALLRYLDRGGNLIVLGGKPFTRAAYRDGDAWKLREPGVAAGLELFIQGWQKTPGSSSLRFEPNPDVVPALTPFGWTQAWSPVIRLSVVNDPRDTSAATGSEDAFLTTLAWGVQGGHKLAAPAMMIDHVKNRFVGGRWIFLACDPAGSGFTNPALLTKLQALALREDDRFSFSPRLPLFVQGEALSFQFTPRRGGSAQPGDVLKVSVQAQGAQAQHYSFTPDASKPVTLPPRAAQGKGMHAVAATLWHNGAPVWTHRSGFWMRDLAYLRNGPRLTVNADYFQLDGKPLPVVGTTYMAGDVDRAFLSEPNAYVWDQDMAQIQANGLNMIRTGIWSGWNRLVNPDASMTEASLRAIEAFLMTARSHKLPVQFNLFAFVPDVFGGGNAYLDPVARKRQDRFVHSIVQRFSNVPFVVWDLINEPSANKNEWKTLPTDDPLESHAWQAWLKQRYPDQPALLAAWAEPSFGKGRVLESKATAVPPEVESADPLALPAASAFDPDGVRNGANPLKVYDYYLFTQSVFNDWVKHQRETIRSGRSTQLVTVGQDAGGVATRLAPAFFSPLVDFTTTHMWWDFDSSLWAALSAKMPDKPMLVQEMGEQRRLTQRNELRFSDQVEAWQLERKLAISFAQGAGGLEWVWNVNARMAQDNETEIGAIRPDGTEKPEARVLAGFARFVSAHPSSFTRIEPPAVTLVTSQSQLYTGMIQLAMDTQKKALRALAYDNHTPARMLPENRLGRLGHPKLVMLPAAQALTDAAWKQLLDYVAQGGTLLVSGPVQRNEHWQHVDRLTPLGLKAAVFPIAVRQSTLQLPGSNQPLQISYPADVQQAPVDTMRFDDGASISVLRHGAGTLIWAADPVALADGYSTQAALYGYALKKAGVAPAFTPLQPLSPGVLVFPTLLKDAVLYSFASDSLQNQTINIKDAVTDATIHFTLGAQRGAMVLLNRSTGAVLAAYGDAAGREPSRDAK